MLSWKLCFHNQVTRSRCIASVLGRGSADLGLRRLAPHSGCLRELHSTARRGPQGLARLLVVAASRSKKGSGKGKGKREFHGTPPTQYKSGPGTAKWRYDNVLSKPAPQPKEVPAKEKRLRRFYVPTETVRDAHKGAVFQLSESETKHALRVLRMVEGDMLEVCDGNGLLIEAQLRGLTFSNTAFAVATSEVQQVDWTGPRWEIVAALGGLRGGRAETLVEKVSEFGAWSLRPLLTNRSQTIGKFDTRDALNVTTVEELSDVSEFEDENDFVAKGRLGRWERVAIAACKQSLRCHALQLRPPCLLKGLIPLIQSGSPAFVATQGAPPLLSVLADNMERVLQPGPSGKPLPCMLLVGPEGDFTDEEMRQLLAAGAKPVGLGNERLRVEGAALKLMAGALLMSESLETAPEKEKKLRLQAFSQPQVATDTAGKQLRRFYVASEKVKTACKGAVLELSESETKHALRVLRMREGDLLEVCDGRGLLVKARLKGLTASNLAFAVATSDVQQVEWTGPRWENVAALGGLRGGRAEVLVEKVSEFGAWSLRPLLTSRSRTIGKFEEKDTIEIVSVDEPSDASEYEEEESDFVATGRLGRWERVSIASCKQSLRCHALLLRPPCLLKGLIPLIQSGSPAFVATQGAPPLLSVLADNMERVLQPGPSGKPLPCMLLVGPEGDFTDEEMQQLLAAGAKPVGLGNERLRVEGAALKLMAGATLMSESLRHAHEKEGGHRESLAA